MDVSEWLFESKQGRKFTTTLYGWGAAVVIVGALFKINHWPGATMMLIIGMGTEGVIFFISGFEPLHEELDWSLVYPELAGMEEGEGENKHKPAGSVTEELDNMLEDAKIGPELIESLGNGLRNLSDNANKLSEISDASVATNEYASSLKNASYKVGELASTYEEASQALTGLKESQEAGAAAGQHLQAMSQNISALNAIYELQLQSANEHMKATNEVYAGISNLMHNLNDSVDDTQRYKENIAELSKNLSALNTVYGNMLSAMNINPRA